MDTIDDAAADIPDGATAQNAIATPDPLDARLRRMAALKKVTGIWKDRSDIPADGLDYERELRDEWR